MDPISFAIVTAAAGGVAVKVVEKAWSIGEQWITDYFRNHGEEVGEKAKENALSFLTKVAESVETIQLNPETNPVTLEVINTSFKDPSFTATLHKAIITAAQTSDEDKHKILARMISERLLSGTEDLVSLATSIAVERISVLKAKHLYILGLLALIDQIRPASLPRELQAEQVNQKAWDWWLKNLSPLIHKAERMTTADVMHLVGANCIQHEEFLESDLAETLKIGFGTWDAARFLSETEEGGKLNTYFDAYLGKMQLTSVGMLIGTYVKDQVTGIRTVIKW